MTDRHDGSPEKPTERKAGADANSADATGQAAIDEAAQDWFFTLAESTVTEDDHARFTAWRDADPRHAAAYDELCAVWDDIDSLRDAFAPPSARADQVQDHASPRPHHRFPGHTTRHTRMRLGRRQPLWGGLVAACVVLAVVAAPEVTTRLAADHRTGVGEQARVALPDGSVAWLNTDTAIAVDYDGSDRRIALLRGEAQFEVARDPERPFAVTAHGGRSTAIGTIFAVREQGVEATTVIVSEGRVEVVSPADKTDAAPADPAARAVLSAGEQVAYRESATLGPVHPAPAKALAWRDGVIVIENLPLAEALAEIDRYHPGRIVLLADTERLEPVTARLSTGAIDRGLDTLAATQNLRVTRVTDYLVLIR
ncbi:FecR family protein [Pelagibius sp.]|uniref:FecR family protein n=1 Tax=Pelagibius sp. TaxID=1931238 RepID=UPI003BB0ACB2